MKNKITYPLEDVVEDTVFIVRKFAQLFNISWRDTYNYLRRYRGLDFLVKHYGYEHTQPAYRTIEAIAEVCRKNGGNL